MTNDLAQALNDGDLLFRCEEFELYKGKEIDKRIFIRVGELLNKKEKGNPIFAAIPHLFIREASEQFIGHGDSSEAALIDCLSKIKNLTTSDIIASSSIKNED